MFDLEPGERLMTLPFSHIIFNQDARREINFEHAIRRRLSSSSVMLIQSPKADEYLEQPNRDTLLVASVLYTGDDPCCIPALRGKTKRLTMRITMLGKNINRITPSTIQA